MRKNTTKAKLAAGKSVIGFWLMYDWPECVEVAGLLGTDYIIFDAEHGYLGIQEIAALVRAAESVEITPLARVPRNAPDVILSFLDAGVQGILVPQLNTREEAERAVKAVKYYPEGERGVGYGHSMDHGLRLPFSEDIKVANLETMVIPQCESKQALENLEEIANVPGVDAIFVGTNDLAQSLGVPGQLSHPLMVEAVAQAKKIVLGTGKVFSLAYPTGDKARQGIDQGVRMVSHGIRPLLIGALREYLTKARAGV